ncbi:nucleotide exchange factor GrpE [Actinophytocola glycyrrhizae]|uniref:Nucleotide exchange factor GrpE n=1 Tax=Actinophytocola glycyrrhizae TaxID=2044873 RepID=A0ABV9S9C2_9PSEU
MADETYRNDAHALLRAFNHRSELDSLLDSLIPVLDSFDRLRRGTENGPVPKDPAALLETFGRIGAQLESAVAHAGLLGFGAPGDAVDLDRYRIVDAVPGGGVREDTVVEVLRRGYEKDGRVLRSAEVIVAERDEEQAQ